VKPPLGPNPFSGSAPTTTGTGRTAGPTGVTASGQLLLDDAWFAKEASAATAGIAKVKLLGHMELRLSLHAEINKSQLELLNAAKASQIRTFGWPIGLVATREEYGPRPYPDGIRTEISIDQSAMTGRPSYDYWALRSNGDFYLLQSLFEDDRAEKKIFFNTRIVRVTESLMFASKLYSTLGVGPETRLSVRVTHRGLAGRELTSAGGNRFIWPSTPTQADESRSEIVVAVGSILETIVDDVRRLLAPLFMLFDFKGSTRRSTATSSSVSSRASRHSPTHWLFVLLRRLHVPDEIGSVLMLVPDEIRECVTFVYCNEGGVRRPIGTAFFVAIPIKGSDRAWGFTVTAAHLLRRIESHGVDQRVHLRINVKDPDDLRSRLGNTSDPRRLETDGAGWMDADLDFWVRHPTDESADVAVFPFLPPEEVFRFRSFSLESAVTPEVISQEGIGIGDEVFIVGLFVNHIGKRKNIPIIRIGNIAAMPEERIQTNSVGPIEAYLVEALSIGGLSGSPVFAHLPAVRVHDNALKITTDGGGVFRLLGLIHGHFDVDHRNASTLTDEKINMGIAMVVPAEKIIETVNRPEVLEMKNRGGWKLRDDIFSSGNAGPGTTKQA